MMIIAAIDQGTTSSKVLIYNEGSLLAKFSVPVNRSHPHDGWIEQDPNEIYSSVIDCLLESTKNLLEPIHAIGISNQRETTVAWDRITGEPLSPAIVWCDSRTKNLVKAFTKKYHTFYFNNITGLPLHSYVSAFKMKWMLQNIENVQDAAEKGTLCFGTVDSWLVWKLSNHQSFITDITNASRTCLMNIKTGIWDQQMLENFLPQIVPSCGQLAVVNDRKIPKFVNCPIRAILGDQQAALFAQSWDPIRKITKEEIVKVTYGTGAFILWNIGKECLFSNEGLITTIAYRFSNDEPPVYALEGAVAFAGATIDWLHEKIGVIKDLGRIDASTLNSYDMSKMNQKDPAYLVPAFTGLFCPYWSEDARGLIIGFEENCDKNDIAFAGIRSCAYQTEDIMKCAISATLKRNLRPSVMLVDGGLAQSDILLRSLADITGMEIKRPINVQSITALGVAMMVAKSFNKMISPKTQQDDFSSINEIHVFKPTIDEVARIKLYKEWKRSVSRSLSWINCEKAPSSSFTYGSKEKILYFALGVGFAYTIFNLLKK